LTPQVKPPGGDPPTPGSATRQVPARLATGFATAEESPGLTLWQVTNRWQAAQRAALKPLGLTHVQFVLLASLAWLTTEGTVTQKNLADHAATDIMMTSQVLRALEERGLVRREPHPLDKRARSLTVTGKGRQLADRAVAVVEACDRAFFQPIGDDIGVLNDLLHGLAAENRNGEPFTTDAPGPARP
jgi:DNA-binding MarR family transcriptional regulator